MACYCKYFYFTTIFVYTYVLYGEVKTLRLQNNSNLKVNKKKRTMKHGAIIFNLMVIQQVLA